MPLLDKFMKKLTPPKATLSLRVSRNSFALGESIDGDLTVSSSEDFDAEQIRCEVRCVEERKVLRRIYDERLKHEVEREVWESATLYSANPILSGPIHINVGFNKSFPFSIGIPATGRPSYKSIDRRVKWTIKGVIAVKGRLDRVSETIEVDVVQPSVAPIVKEKEVVIREVVMIQCQYCGTLIPQTATTCPHCGAPRK
ncbi:MAG: zinc ribbon domain-containing protein [Candidatus Methanomethylicia archaeon]